MATTMPAISEVLNDAFDFAGGGVIVEVELADDGGGDNVDDDDDDGDGNDELSGVVYFIINITLNYCEIHE